MPLYTLRVSVKTLGEAPVNGLESEPTIEIGKTRLTVKQRGRFLILMARDFPSEADAAAFLPKLKGGLWNLAIEHNIAFTPYFGRREVTRPEDPYTAARNLAKSFGTAMEEPVQPVHGLTEEEGVTIFSSDENIRFIGMGDVTARVSTAWATVAATLISGIERVASLSDDADADLATARDSLEALRRETDFRKETSIRRRIRRLVLDQAPLSNADRKALAKQVVAAYDLRGSVVHTGAIDSKSLADANEAALHAVKLLLRVRLGLVEVPARE